METPNKYMIVVPYNSSDKIIYQDVFQNDEVTVYYLNNNSSNKIYDFFRRVHTSLKINSIINLPFRSIYYRDLQDILKNGTIVIFQHICAAKIGKKGLADIKKSHTNIKLVLILVDSFKAHSSTLFMAKKIINDFPWDCILSYDKDDCDKYGFIYLGCSYYSVDFNIQKSKNSSDIYYVGRCKDNDGRLEKILTLSKEFMLENVNANINLVNSSVNTYKLCNIKNYNKEIPYEQVLADVLASNCILEILQDGQHFQTLRYFEAVCYNKKLLTNNIGIKELPYYNPKYMHIFSNEEDIDLDWIKKKESIDYHYRGDFSSKKILEILNNIQWPDENHKYKLVKHFR